MRENKFIEFLKMNLGLLIGLIVGALIVLFGWVRFFVNLAIMFSFGFLGVYVQRNKSKVKSVFTNLLKNIVAKMED